MSAHQWCLLLYATRRPCLSGASAGLTLRSVHYLVRAKRDLQALGLMPNDPGTLAALAFTYHMMGKLPQAIEMYHKAQAFKSDCSFTAALLPRALKEHCEHCCKNDDPGLM